MVHVVRELARDKREKREKIRMEEKSEGEKRKGVTFHTPWPLEKEFFVFARVYEEKKK